MIFEQHHLDRLSQASYVIGDETTGGAAVVEFRGDIGVYVESAADRSFGAASRLAVAGFTDVSDLLGGNAAGRSPLPQPASTS